MSALHQLVIGHFPECTTEQRRVIGHLVDLLVEVADEVDAAPLVVETRWGQPSLRSARANESTPLRLGLTGDGDVVLLAHCQSSVIPALRDRDPEGFRLDGNRGVLFAADDDVDADRLRPTIEHALTYRRR